MAAPYAGTQIAPNGQRYTTGAIPAAALINTRITSIPVVRGNPNPADVIWYDPTTRQPKWVDLETVEDFYPRST